MITNIKTYNTIVDDYNGLSNGAPTPKEVAARRKLSLLRDFGILKHMDKREDAVYNILMKCRDEHHMTRLLHDVLREIETLDELIARWRN